MTGLWRWTPVCAMCSAKLHATAGHEVLCRRALLDYAQRPGLLVLEDHKRRPRGPA